MSPSDRLRTLGVMAAVGLLLILVAATAVDVPGAVPSGRLLSLDTDSVTEWAVPLIRLAYLALLLFALYTWLTERQPRAGRRRETKRVSPLATFVALVLVAGFVVLVAPTLRKQPEAATTTTGTPEARREEPAAPTPGGVPLGAAPGAGWWVMLVAGGGALAYLIASRRRDGEVEAGAPRAAGAIFQPSGAPPMGSLDAAGRVLAAYRRVETAAAAGGFRRAPAETVAQHLGRVAAVTSPESASELTDLFHRARYSRQPVSEEAAAAAEHDGRRIVERLGE
ncbi:MAG TPA: DUF4129 domain-containing protein [Acidimicrobiia bacterium]|nr:DUF4129 domain-containing protein [Acidimicrobiia bacterium]